MDKMVQPDLNQFLFETDSFLGKALALGRQYGQLPEYVGDALMAYLSAQSLAFARRYRTGIAIGRERLERGLKQAFICVELGLEEGSGRDLNQAVDLLAGGDLEALRRRGWEEALARLDRMRAQSRAWNHCREVLFLREYQDQLSQWRQLVPESWTSRNPEDEEVWIDPRREYLCFQEVESRLVFLRSLPGASLEELLQAAPEGGTFAAVLRHLVLALALGLERLAVKQEELIRFRRTCFTAGRMLPAVKDRVLSLFAAHLEKAMPAGREETAIARDLAGAIKALERASPEELEELFAAAPRQDSAATQGFRP